MTTTADPVRTSPRSRADAEPDRSRPSYIFIIGTGRCGSTMLAETLCRHPDVGFISNVDERFPRLAGLGRWNNPVYRHLPSARILPKRFVPSEAYGLLDREVSPILSSPFRDLGERDASPWLSARVEACFARRAAAQHTPAFLHKFTGWPRAGFLHRTFPSARFIHVVRDGRAVANSLLQVPWWRGFGGPDQWQWGPLPPHLAREWENADRSFVVLAGLLWRMLMDSYDVARAALPDDSWLEVRYEDLTASPEQTLREILEFSGLGIPAQFTRGIDRQRFHVARVDAFRRDLDPDELARMTAAIAPALMARGYTPA